MNLRRKYLSFKRSFFPRFFSSNNMIEMLKIDRISVGKKTIFYDPSNIIVDSTRPELLSIGEYCKITTGVVILTHDYSRSVLRRKYGELLGEGKKTIIGNNVFIGINSIILMGAHIGNNCIIGAGSIVSSRFGDNLVIGGNPAKVIMTLDEYYAKKKDSYLRDAKDYVKHFYDFYQRMPTVYEMGHFFPLFLERESILLNKYQISLQLNGDEESEILKWFLESKPLFNGLEDFLNYCKQVEKP